MVMDMLTKVQLYIVISAVKPSFGKRVSTYLWGMEGGEPSDGEARIKYDQYQPDSDVIVLITYQ